MDKFLRTGESETEFWYDVKTQLSSQLGIPSITHINSHDI